MRKHKGEVFLGDSVVGFLGLPGLEGAKFLRNLLVGRLRIQVLHL
ncbi:hypothetical protein [Pseudomonas sp. ZB1P45]